MSTVSVVIPAFNAEQTLSRAIESVRSQTYPDIELIIVNDASSDGTSDVVNSYEDTDIRYEEHKTNRGGSAARNTGIEAATGEYIAFLDADDEWKSDKLERQLTELEAKPDEYVAVHCNRVMQMTWSTRLGYALSHFVGTRERNPPVEGGEELIKEILLLNLSTGASTLLVETDTVNEIGGFDASYPRHQDWEFLMRVLQQGKLAYVDEPLVIKHGTGRPGPKVHEEAKELLFSDFESEIDQLERQGYPVRHTQRLHLAKQYLEAGQLSKGRSQLELSALSVPEFLSVAWSVAAGLRNWFR